MYADVLIVNSIVSVLVYIMVGDNYSGSNHELNQLLPEFSVIVQDIFECTAPLMAIPATFAEKYKLSIWRRFEKSVTRTLEIANEIVDVGLKMRGNGLLNEMQANKMSTEMIRRIFVDLIIAAGDTVNHQQIGAEVEFVLTNYFFLIDCLHHAMGSVPTQH